jgi:hypothetical protein
LKGVKRNMQAFWTVLLVLLAHGVAPANAAVPAAYSSHGHLALVMVSLNAAETPAPRVAPVKHDEQTLIVRQPQVQPQVMPLWAPAPAATQPLVPRAGPIA